MSKYWGRVISGSGNQVAQWIVNHSKIKIYNWDMQNLYSKQVINPHS